MSASPRDPRLFALFSGAIETGLEYVRLEGTGKVYIGKHENWPELQWHENGLPYVTSRGADGPTNYSDAIRPGAFSFLYGLGAGSKETIPDFEKEPSFLALLDYAGTHSRLRSYLMFERSGDFGEMRLQGMVGHALDRYIHVAKTQELDRNQLLPVYLPLENRLLDEILPATVIVPILFLKFAVDHFRISEFGSVGKLSDDLHIARGWHGPWGNSENSLVESAATHALFISNRSLENHNWMALGQTIMQPESYPVEMIDAFFAALRISTGYTAGYAQLLTLPIGWALDYTADLTPLEGPTVKRYPPVFERGAWNDDVPTASSADADGITETFAHLWQVLGTGQGRKVRLAMHRLNLSAMRTTDEDGIIDAMIAMEALLSGEGQEMTHKVAMRLAGLYKLVDRSRSEQAFREMKRIYSFRSKIVHGATDLDKSRELDRDGEKVSAVDAGVEHLRTAFAVLIKHPVLLDPTKIDSFLLTDTL